jgi:DNA-binding NarL/FixJ family response regulator
VGGAGRRPPGWFGAGWFGAGWFGAGWFGAGWFGAGWFGAGWFGAGWFGAGRFRAGRLCEGRGGGMTIRVLLADDQALIRSGLRLLLENEPDLTVIAEAADGTEAVRLARKLRPDVCLVDIRMPGLDGVAVTSALAGPGVAEPIPVVIVTTFDLDEYVYGALRAGAVGFVLKGSGPALLVEAVRAAAAGDALISPQITLRLLRRLAPVGPAPRRPFVPLSERELEVVRIIATGRTNQEIAAELFISLSTVKTHLAAIQQKLGVRNRVQIAAWAWESPLRRP